MRWSERQEQTRDIRKPPLIRSVSSYFRLFLASHSAPYRRVADGSEERAPKGTLRSVSQAYQSYRPQLVSRLFSSLSPYHHLFIPAGGGDERRDEVKSRRTVWEVDQGPGVTSYERPAAEENLMWSDGMACEVMLSSLSSLFPSRSLPLPYSPRSCRSVFLRHLLHSTREVRVTERKVKWTERAEWTTSDPPPHNHFQAFQSSTVVTGWRRQTVATGGDWEAGRSLTAHPASLGSRNARALFFHLSHTVHLAYGVTIRRWHSETRPSSRYISVRRLALSLRFFHSSPHSILRYASETRRQA